MALRPSCWGGPTKNPSKKKITTSTWVEFRSNALIGFSSIPRSSVNCAGGFDLGGSIPTYRDLVEIAVAGLYWVSNMVSTVYWSIGSQLRSWMNIQVQRLCSLMSRDFSGDIRYVLWHFSMLGPSAVCSHAVSWAEKGFTDFRLIWAPAVSRSFEHDWWLCESNTEM